MLDFGRKQVSHFINNQWVEGEGGSMSSQNPATNETIWEGREASKTQIDLACKAGEKAFISWSLLSFEQRLEKLKVFQEIITHKRKTLGKMLSEEHGKPLWEADGEVASMIGKLPIALEAYKERCPEKKSSADNITYFTRHKPHGVLAIFSPFNFPAHLPNAHIIPALLAGNTIVLKGSPLTPRITEIIMQCWEEALLPQGVINLIQGAGEVGKSLIDNNNIRGVLFTGSYRTGHSIYLALANNPEKILALEMGGNNPLVIHDLKNEQEIEAAVYHTIQSAYLTSGQRCTCARRLILTRSHNAERFIEKLMIAIQKIVVGPYNQQPEPYMGPVISLEAKAHILKRYQNLIDKGAKVLVEMRDLGNQGAFLSPGLLDIAPIPIKDREDEEIFGPLLQVIWVKDFEEALKEANNTRYGLSSGLLTSEENLFQQFYTHIRAGLVNWNRPLTGASSHAPFGGIGKSGNFRPAGYYAADYCAYPVSSLLEQNLRLPDKFSPGLSLE